MQRPRTPSKLSESLHQWLNAYALAASTAGVGVLALAQPAEGKIIYTPAHVECSLATGGCDWRMIRGGKKTFAIGIGTTNTSEHHETGMSVDPFRYTTSSQKINGIAESAQHAAYALRAGTPINGKLFRTSLDWAEMAQAWQRNGKSYFRDPWANHGKGVKNHYLGLRFTINGTAHYGWARLNVRVSKGIHATLNGYAYETVPNKPIIAGKTKGPSVITVEPASLGHLARGASAIPDWRTKEMK
jgi:hypothetical protein